jgi:hypothetical protein
MREHRTSYSAPPGNVAGGVLVCVCNVSAGKAPKLRLGLATALVDCPALAASLACVGGVDGKHRNTNQRNKEGSASSPA